MKSVGAALVTGAVLLAGCALYNEVSIRPAFQNPAGLDRGSDMRQMLDRADFLRAYEMAKTVDARPRKNVHELAALGSAELAGGRFDEARRHLRQVSARIRRAAHGRSMLRSRAITPLLQCLSDITQPAIQQVSCFWFRPA